MSGHNKWSKIKHKKAATDAKKSKEFGKLVRELKVVVRETGGNADSPAVQAIIDRARAINMPKDNIERAIKGAQGGEGERVEAVLYEAYLPVRRTQTGGPGGVALLIEAATDNKNRTAPEIKKILGAYDTDLARPGAASWAFENKSGQRTPKATISLSDTDKKKLEQLINELEAHEEIELVITNGT